MTKVGLVRQWSSHSGYGRFKLNHQIKNLNFSGDFIVSAVLLNLFLTSSLLTLVLWIARTNPILGGFIISLPLSTMIVLALSKLQNQNVGDTFLLSKSILVGIPASMLFFVPFLLADRLKLGFWMCYGLGFLMLGLSYFIHKWVVSHYLA